MRGEPTPNLVQLLARLRLATAQQLHGVASQVRRLAGDLPDFESVWVDALAQAGALTRYQAAQINAGHGDDLVHGSFVILHPVASPHYAECFAARHVETARTVRLYLVRRPRTPAVLAARTLRQLIEQLSPLAGGSWGVIEDAGTSDSCVWAVGAAVKGTTVASWIVENGRFPPAVVLQIAREMTAGLSELEQLGVAHGDLGTAGLLIQPSGRVALPMPGLRGIVRASEGYSFNDLRPEGYDCLPPERISAAGGVTIAGDIYACGCLWWQLLSGRACFAGGNSLAKLRAVHAAKVCDVLRLAPETSAVLARAIGECMMREPSARPQSFAQVAAMLGPSARSGHAGLAACLSGTSRLWQVDARARSRPRRTPRVLKATGSVAAVVLLVAIGSWPLWKRASEVRAPTALQLNDKLATLVPVSVAKRTGEANLPAGASVASPAPGVRPAVAYVPVEQATLDLILPLDRISQSSTLKLAPGRIVRGQPGTRPIVSVSREGLLVECEGISFDGIDFIWEKDAEADEPHGAIPAMVRVAAQSVEFRRCSFSTAVEKPPAAVVWHGGAEAPQGAPAELIFTDCALRGVSAVVDCRGRGGLSVEMDNVLAIACGPLMRLRGVPASGEAVAISLNRLTTRGNSAVLECRYGRAEQRSGTITVTATDSVLDGNARGGLLVFSGPGKPDSIVKVVAWNGQGSLVTPHMAMALWRSDSQKQQTLSEDTLEVAGLVRSKVEYAGSAAGPPSASRLTRWQVPLRSEEPPGANVHALFLPEP